jgi:hypothetical protein
VAEITAQPPPFQPRFRQQHLNADFGDCARRANRTFNWQTKRLTLFVEVMNVLGRENLRYEQPGVNVRSGQAFGIFNSMIPRVPSAGVLIAF